MAGGIAFAALAAIAHVPNHLGAINWIDVSARGRERRIASGRDHSHRAGSRVV